MKMHHNSEEEEEEELRRLGRRMIVFLRRAKSKPSSLRTSWAHILSRTGYLNPNSKMPFLISILHFGIALFLGIASRKALRTYDIFGFGRV